MWNLVFRPEVRTVPQIGKAFGGLGSRYTHNPLGQDWLMQEKQPTHQDHPQPSWTASTGVRSWDGATGVERMLQYGLHIQTLCQLLKAGYFD